MPFINPEYIPCEVDMLVGFYDLTAYQRLARDMENLAVLDAMAAYFHLTGGILADAGGLLVKSMGDAGLAVFHAEDTDVGVEAFLELKARGDELLPSLGFKSRAKVMLHLGPVACGMVGPPDSPRFDVYGNTVNTAATLASDAFSMSPQVFRKLSTAARKKFKKHTPPVTYICLDDRH